MSRLSLNRAVVFRKSCFREVLGFNFHIVKTEEDAVERAVAMALTVSEADSKVLVFATTVKTCEEIGARIQSDDSFTGCDVYSCNTSVKTSHTVQEYGMYHRTKQRFYSDHRN